ncbi:MAG TPA: hypothetical protein VFN88_01275, partial [Caulobacteraceae bacterium]|nr:hypothetical protein [Caulobacteraceae bacterium]
MALFPIELPPGVFRSGTELQSSGRYFDADLVRWRAGALEPVGGWKEKTGDRVSGAARAIRVWPDNDGQAWVAVGTHSNLYVMDRGGEVTDITPVDFVPGIADSDYSRGYGDDKYGEYDDILHVPKNDYGTPRRDKANARDVTVWSLDTFGEDLVGCTADDGKIYEWTPGDAGPAAPVDGAPTARALVVTAERILMALGANGNPRALAWSNQEDDTDWTPSTSDYAGDFVLQTAGKLMAGRRVRGGTLLLTDSDVWLAEFLGQPLVYGFEQKGGAGTGIIAQGAVATMDGEAVPAQAVWMGQQGFFAYNGYVQPLPCDVAGLVFSDIHRDQISKVSAFHNADFGEVTWFYPSGESLENDRYVSWNYRENWWTLGRSGVRLCGTEKGPLAYPLGVDAAGAIFEHEIDFYHGGADPFAETGPFLIGEGDKVVQVTRIIPDEQTLGDVTAQVFLRFQPKGPETAKGPFSLKAETDVRFT